MIDFAVVAGQKPKLKESKKREKYQDLGKEVKTKQNKTKKNNNNNGTGRWRWFQW